MRPASDVCGAEAVAEGEATPTGAAVTETLELLLLLDISSSEAKRLCPCRRLKSLAIDIRDYVTRIGNGARALRKVRTKFNVPSVLRLLRFEHRY